MIPAPVLPAVLTPAAPGLPAQLHVRCEQCEGTHSHGADPGLRAAHCHRKESPYLATGYILKVVGEAATPDVLTPNGLLVGRRRLSETLDAAAPRLRAAFVRHVVGRKRIGRARISVFDRQWTIDTDVHTGGPASRWISGVGLLGLLSALYGVSRGVAGVRLFEGITGEKLDALARVTIAEAIDAATVRTAGSPEGCA